MNRMLHANFNRLFKSKFFWLSSGFMLLLGLLPIDRWMANQEGIAEGYSDSMWHLEDDFFNYLIAIFFMVSIMTVLYIGAEYSNGTIRNKIVVGQKRPVIYLANLITLATGIVIWTAIYIAVYLAVGIPLLGMFTVKLSGVISMVLLALLLSITLMAIILLVAMLCQNKTYAAIACLMLIFVMLVSGIVINSWLEEPEYYAGYAYMNTDTGELTKEDRQLNPNYVSGTKRVILEEGLNITPGGQMLQICDWRMDHLGKLALYDLVIFALSTGIGIVVWRRKDLK